MKSPSTRNLAILLAVAAALAVTACSVPQRRVLAVHALAGRVDWGRSYGVQATMSEVSTDAVVSLIDTVSDDTMATGQTNASGTFTLTCPSDFVPVSGEVYVLEAAKGLSVGGVPNRAGTSLVRVRTLVSYSLPAGQWTSLNGPSGPIVISRSTTAISILAASLGYPSMMGSLIVGQPSAGGSIPDTFAPQSGSLTQSEFATAFGLVDMALRLDEDPVATITGPPTALVRTDPLFAVTHLQPTIASAGAQVVVYGSHFPPDPSLLTVLLAPLTGSTGGGLTSTASTTTSLVINDDSFTFTVPDLGTATGDLNLSVRVDGTTNSGPILQYEGHS